ncbi:hypothetical protein NDA18_003136 [Ustilago nuda]|uniref:Uncharacterized protein n=1 Tax=Ustilago hordei TaxID=120017 RepID=I2G1L5_USTHO|nr:uncharacterized protein UHO2_02472 [Ustilago hordei]KAJ1027120.1 hypothetical protein NDA18_003136 [Ustilago nuda]KAJ1040138.1 hypothetical protein NDA10_002403 [Ustilago hordei]KAJ1584870.1 hypothetical protein NDA15_000334 [Ustilago hordei]KAJ1588074.1 hypothetical protein NDA12_003524 [Ustilago hordei]KAJ1592913.1 hypothetical protein NDA11_003053 [Ustilago hordei]
MAGWYLIPSVLIPLIIVGAVASRFFGAGKKGGYTGKYDPKTGLGRGAPGFQTGVKRMAVTPEIAARMRAGEQVSQEEIEEALARAQSQNAGSSTAIRNPNVDQDWLPQGGRSPAGNKSNKRR